MGVTQICLRLVQVTLVQLYCAFRLMISRGLRVEFLFRDHALVQQVGVSLEIDLREFKLSLIARSGTVVSGVGTIASLTNPGFLVVGPPRGVFPSSGAGARAAAAGAASPAGDAGHSGLAAAEPAETVYVLPTYTAMLALRDILRRTGYVRGFWED